ncbi:MAG: Hpt domain-containing protein [Oscillospiraceae bacterium]|nr:Hpt domain-containing protein [Oscillospiraceae bacterium]
MDFNELCEKLHLDHAGMLRRFSGQEAILIKFFKKFPDDPTFLNLKDAVEKNDTVSVEHTAHTLKGICANLGITSVSDPASNLVNAVRAGEYDKIGPLFAEISKAYTDICGFINRLNQ